MTNNEKFLRTYKACIENVGQYLEDVEKMKEIGNYGRGYALAAIGSEELSKAAVYYFRYHSLIPYDPKKDRRIIRNHIKKLALQRVLLAFVDFYQSRGKDRPPSSTEGKDMREILNNMETLVNENDFISLISKVFEERLKAQEIQKAKEKGLYVDLQGDHLVTPQEIKYENLQEQLEDLKKYKEIVEQFVYDLDNAPPSEMETLQSELRNLSNVILDEEFLSKAKPTIEALLKKVEEKRRIT